MRLKEQHNNTTSTTDLNNNCVQTDDHLVQKPVYLQLKRTDGVSKEQQGQIDNRTASGSPTPDHLDSIELKELNSNHHVSNNNERTSPISSPHSRQPSPSQFSFSNLSISTHLTNGHSTNNSTNNNHSKCNGVCIVNQEPKSCKQQLIAPHRHLTASHSNGTVASQKIQIQLNGNAFSPSLTSLSSLNALNSNQQHSPLVPSYLSNSSKYTGYSSYGKLTHGAEHLPNTSSLCIDNIHSKTKIYNFKVVIVGEMASGKTSYIRKLTQPKNGSRNRYNYYMATKGVEAKCKLFEYDDNTLVNLEFWEIGGQENYVQMADMFCRDAFGAILMFDVQNKQSLESLLKWKQSLDASVRLNDNKSIPTVLVANKCDLETSSSWLMPDMLDSFCKKNNILTYFYASVRKNVNLENICKDLIEEMLIKYQHKEYKTFNSNHHKKKSLKKYYKCSHCTIL